MAGGAAGRAMAGGAAGLAAAAGAAGGPGFLCSWAEASTLAAITQAPSTDAAKRTPIRSIIIVPRPLFGCPPSPTRESGNRSPRAPPLAPLIGIAALRRRVTVSTKRSMRPAVVDIRPVRSAGMPKRRPSIPSTPARRAGLRSRPQLPGIAITRNPASSWFQSAPAPNRPRRW
jgi:hypothetical protein